MLSVTPVHILLLLLLPVTALSAAPLWEGAAHLDQHFWLWWRPGPREILFKLEARTTGYLGLALTRRDAHPPTTDVVVAWVDSDGTGHLHDCYLPKGKTLPLEDPVQNYKLIESSQNGTHTTITFSRPWDTCDRQHDVPIVNDTMRVMWTMSKTDPGLFSSWSDLTWHGNKGIHIGTPARISLSDNDRFWDVSAQDLLLPTDSSTVYWCKIYKVPDLQKKHHIIGYKPLIRRGHEFLVQHMILYVCLGSMKLEQYGDHEGAECHSQNVPKDWDACVTPVVVWTIGSQGEFYPDTFGLPMAEGEGKATYFMLEIHYDNPHRQKVRDSSGLRLFYTSELRPHDGSMFMTGIAVSPVQIIPPLQQKFVTNGYCDNQCTNLMFPESGINVASVVFHSHGAGREMRLRHIREGKELQVIAQDKQYDPTYQQSRRIPDNTKILPGDDIITECQYSTVNRSKLLVGGYSARQETCVSYILYYPRMTLASCTSMTPVDSFFQTFGVNEFYNHNMEKIEENVMNHTYIQKPSKKSPSKDPMQKLFFRFSEKQGFNMDLNKKSVSILRAMTELNTDIEEEDETIFSKLIINKPEEFQNKSFMDHLRDLPWTDRIFTQSVEEILHKGKYRTFCKLQDNSPAMPSGVYSFPNITHKYKENKTENHSKCNYDTDSASALFNKNVILLVLSNFVVFIITSSLIRQ